MMKRLFFILFLASATFSTSVFAATERTVKGQVLSTQEITDLLNTWVAAVQSYNPTTVSSLYTENAVLHPTLWDKMLQTNKEINGYFVSFLAKKPTVEIIANQTFGGVNYAVNTGLYNVTMTDEKTGTQKTVKARYTFTYEFINKKWVITSHVSAVVPQEK
jgi:uncharacterized protein (TIGR02246 family)